MVTFEGNVWREIVLLCAHRGGVMLPGGGVLEFASRHSNSKYSQSSCGTICKKMITEEFNLKVNLKTYVINKLLDQYY